MEFPLGICCFSELMLSAYLFLNNFSSVLAKFDVIGNGGWQIMDEPTIAINGPCTIERIDANVLGQDEFLHEYAYNKPLIIFNVENSIFQKNCERLKMLEKWKNMKIFLNSANTHSYTRVESTFGEYVRNILKPQNINTPGNETLYLFGDMNREEWKPLLDTYILPKWNLPGFDPELSFGIAGAGTGVPFHFHGPGFAEVIYGSKRWFLQPYKNRPNFDPDKSTFDWYTNVYPFLDHSERPMECLLKANEIIYFPDRWWHATLNSETGVFISTFLSKGINTEF